MKTLKIGFAMGGGVSLGSFSGAALSEAIKQAVLNAGYYPGNDNTKPFRLYDDIKIDVFSGASAGSMALAVMLRGLLHRTPKEEAAAMANLKKQGLWAGVANDPVKSKNLIAAQVVQDLQTQIWTKEINLDKLLGTSSEQKDKLAFEPGLLRRGALEDIAKKYFNMKEAIDHNFAGKLLLSEEVLFASTLSNLTGIVYTQPLAVTSPNYIGTRDPYTSKIHKELRVFHLMFQDIGNPAVMKEERYPSKWVRYHLGEKSEGKVSSLKTMKPWARIVATSMACGAFPFAFAPVPLERFKFEYGNKWPGELTPSVCSLATGSTITNNEDCSYPFSYVDGGAFNNEPVKEAFRLANFLDSYDTETDFDRIIIYVDPSVGDSATNFRLPFLQQYAVRPPRVILKKLDDYDVYKKGSLDLLSPHIGTLVSMITNESSVKENIKMMETAALFSDREACYRVFDSIEHMPNQQETDQLIAYITKVLVSNTENEFIPSSALTLNGQLHNVVKGSPVTFSPLKYYEFPDPVSNAPQKYGPHAALLYKALIRILINLLLDLAGKNEDYKIIAIAPARRLPATVDDPVKYESIDLPGGALQAFSGFAYEKANQYAIDLARHCTVNLMKDLEVIPRTAPDIEEPTWSAKDKEKFTEAFISKLGVIHERVDSLIYNAHFVDLFPGLDRFILSQLSSLIKDYISGLDLAEQQNYTFTFKIKVPNQSLEIDGKERGNDVSPVKIGKDYYLITALQYYPVKLKGGNWHGIHCNNDQIEIEKDGFAFLPDKPFCKINLPDIIQERPEALLMPHATFTLELKENMQGNQSLSQTEWTVDPGITLIENTLL